MNVEPARSSSPRGHLEASTTEAVGPPSSPGTALIRRPTPNLADGIVTHIDRQPIDVDLALEQWQGYVSALQAAGWAIVEVAEEPACPDAVFIEDTAVVLGETALICRPGNDARKAEVDPVHAVLADLGYRCTVIEAPGTLDGGDVLKVAGTVYIGLGGRTNGSGIEQATSIFAQEGAQVVAVPNTKVLHLKSAVTALPDGRIIGYEPSVQDRGAFPNFTAMPEEPGAHVVDLGRSNLLMAASGKQSIKKVADLGYQPVPVDIGEFEKLEGCVTCLSIRLRSPSKQKLTAQL